MHTPRRRSDAPGRSEPNENMGVDGFNPSDPGVTMLLDATAGVPPQSIVLVAMGPLPGMGSATRIVLDIREMTSDSRPWVLPGSAELDVPSVAGTHTLALVWPRAHLGKDFTYQCLARAGLELGDGGSVLCAVRKQKGADSVADFMAELFGNVRVEGRSRGYRLLHSRRDARFQGDQARALLRQTYEIRDAVLGELVLRTAPGVFARQKLDAGTRCLIEFAQAWPFQSMPRRVLDVCAGVGPLALWAARQWPEAQVLAIESNLLAVELARRNAADAAVETRVEIQARDGLPPLTEVRDAWRGSVDVALINPPTHADPSGLRSLLCPLEHWLAPQGRAWIVANRPEQISGALASSPFTLEVTRREGYSIVTLRVPA